MHPFEQVLSVSKEEIELELRGINEITWFDFLLNPRRLRGSDFLMRWSQGVWSEKRLIDAINKTNQFYAIPYGPSGTAPTDDVRAFELYFERLEAAGLGNIKRPDLLVFKISDMSFVDKFLKDIGGDEELPFISESNLDDLIQKSIRGGELGRTKGAFIQKERRLKLIQRYRDEGVRELSILTDKEIFIAGIAGKNFFANIIRDFINILRNDELFPIIYIHVSLSKPFMSLF